MKVRILDYSYLFLTILFTVYGQVVLKWRVNLHGSAPADFGEKLKFFMHMLSDVWVLSGFLAGFGAALAWMLTVSKFDLSFAYPFMSLCFVIVLLLSNFIFKEPLSAPKVVGVALIVLGTIVVSRG